MSEAAPAGMPVVVVTGGGGGIGAAVAEQLGREGWFVVTADPLVSLDGSERLPPPEETTAGRIVAAGGAARGSAVSVTDRPAVGELFRGLVDEFGRLDAVINVAGISRPTGFAKGNEDDWRGVLSVHLDGYLNVLGAALPIMAAAGRGRILGVTSGSGWRHADAGAYACAKRAVAALTWQLGRRPPEGVVINAMSPIAVTRMVTAALGAARPPTSGVPATGGLSLGSMPTPEELAPFGAHLVGEAVGWSSGRVFFAGGPEVAVLDEPRLLEVVRTGDVASLAHVLGTVLDGALSAAETSQSSTGGSNPRFGSVFDESGEVPRVMARSCVVTDRPEVATCVTAALESRGATCVTIDAGDVGSGFGGAATALADVVEGEGTLDAVVVALAGGTMARGSTAWERILAEHAGLVDQLADDAAWARAVADLARASDRPIRLVTLTDAMTSGGRSRAQASAQLARAALTATRDHVAAFAVSVETSDAGDLDVLGELAAHLACSAEAVALSGAELVAGRGWVGLRSHPRPSGTISFGGPDLPDWLDDALRRIADPRHEERS